MKCLWKYRNIFGEPRKGIHTYRIFDFAIVDVIFTFIIAFCISRVFRINFIYVLLALFLLGIIMHRIFCVRTTIDRILFPYSFVSS